MAATYPPVVTTTARALDAVLTHLSSSHPPLPHTNKLRHAVLTGYAELARAEGRQAGQAVLAMAGVPGAGKTTALSSAATKHVLPIDYTHYITIDADDIKNILLGIGDHRVQIAPRLLTQARNHWTTILNSGPPSRALPDGRPVLLAELATLVHDLSTQLAAQARADLMRSGYNLIIEGTLQWGHKNATPSQPEELGQGLTILKEMARNGYERLDLFAVDVPEQLARDQALNRWWTGRSKGGDGGRYTPSTAITTLYATGHTQSRCIDNAHDTFQRAANQPLDLVTLTIVNRHTKIDTIEHSELRPIAAEPATRAGSSA